MTKLKKMIFFLLVISVIIAIYFINSNNNQSDECNIYVNHYAIPLDKTIVINEEVKIVYIENILERLDLTDVNEGSDTPDTLDGLGICKIVFYKNQKVTNSYIFDYDTFNFVKINDEKWQRLNKKDSSNIRNLINELLNK